MLVKNISIFVLAIIAALYSSLAYAEVGGVVEITKDNDISITATPQGEAIIYGLNGGNLTISGADTVVTQNLPADNTMAGVNFGNYWPWIEGTVTVENGAKLTSNTRFFFGGGSGENNNTYKNKTRKMIVQSGSTVVFSPENGEAYIVGIENAPVENAFISVSGGDSKLFFPAAVYLGNKSDYAGHSGVLNVTDGAYVEGGCLYVGHHTGSLKLTVDGGAMKWTSGISCFRNGNRWTGATILFKNCTVETAFYKMTYPHGNGGSTVTFNGALFKPVGDIATKFINASPTGDARCPHILTGGGLIVDVPENISLEVSAKFQGDGGFTKRGKGTVVISAHNDYTGLTKVESGRLDVTGSIKGALSVNSGASAVFSSAPILSGLSISEGGRVVVNGYGADVGDVADFSGSFEITGVDTWPHNTVLLKSNTAEFLEKVARELNETVEVEEGYGFSVVEGSVQLVRQGIQNGTIVWTGAGSDTSWSTKENWTGQERRIYSGDTLIVDNGGTSTVDLGEQVVLKSALFNEGISSHTISASGVSDSLVLKNFVTNLSENVQTFNLPIFIGEDDFALHADGDVVFAEGLSASNGTLPNLKKTGEGELVVQGPSWGGGLDIEEGSVSLVDQQENAIAFSSAVGAVRVNGTLDAGGATVFLSDDADGVLGENAILENGYYVYTPRTGYNFLALAESQVLTITNNAVFYTTAGIFENGTGSGRGVRVLDGSTLEFNNNTSSYISSKDNGDAGFLYVSGNSVLKLPRGRTYIAWPNWAGRGGRLDVLDGSFISGGSVEFGWRSSTSYFTLTNSAASFSDGLYLDVNNNIDWAHSHMFVSGSVVTSAVWRVGNPAGNVNWYTELWFDDATLVPNKADTPQTPYFLCTKPDCNQIKIQEGGLKIDTMYDVTFNAPLSGTGGLTKLGEGILELASTNTYAGTTLVSEGTLRLTGRVAGAIEVASGASLEFAISAEGEEVPQVPNLVMEEGSSLKAVTPGLPEGVARVDVLRSSGEILVPAGVRDASGNIFYVSSTSAGNVLRYGRKPGFAVLVR